MGPVRLDFLDYLHPFGNTSEYNVFSIEPVCFDCAQEELRSICVGSSIGHGEDTRPSVLQLKVLISEFFPIDGFSSRTIVASEVTTLKIFKQGERQSVLVWCMSLNARAGKRRALVGNVDK